jgi:membrane protease YdiL (CAAX protease family)
VPADVWTEAARMVACGLIVAAGAATVAGLAWVLAVRVRQPLCPPWKPWRVPWTGFEFLFLFPFAVLGPMALADPLLAGSGFYRAVYGPDAPAEVWGPVRPLWAGLFFLPALLGTGLALRRALDPGWKVPGVPSASQLSVRTVLAVFGWLAIHPLTVMVHFGVGVAFLALGWAQDEHPLVKLFRTPRPVVDQLLLPIQACVVAPLTEELLFRGLLLPWLLGRRRRVSVILGVAVLLAGGLSFLQRVRAEGGDASLMMGPVGFALVLAGGWAVLSHSLRRKRRTAGAVYASAVLFAAVHSGVWPSPVPLFVLGLGLGYLAVRTRGILVPVIVHGLFNAVSAVYVLTS